MQQQRKRAFSTTGLHACDARCALPPPASNWLLQAEQRSARATRVCVASPSAPLGETTQSVQAGEAELVHDPEAPVPLQLNKACDLNVILKERDACGVSRGDGSAVQLARFTRCHVYLAPAPQVGYIASLKNVKSHKILEQVRRGEGRLRWLWGGAGTLRTCHGGACPMRPSRARQPPSHPPAAAWTSTAHGCTPTWPVQALSALGCMEHRGACSADNDSGDGAGLMTQIPWALLKKEFPNLNETTTG
jgi:hypothetical protein